jgi:hypothetical protein
MDRLRRPGLRISSSCEPRHPFPWRPRRAWASKTLLPPLTALSRRARDHLRKFLPVSRHRQLSLACLHLPRCRQRLGGGVWLSERCRMRLGPWPCWRHLRRHRRSRRSGLPRRRLNRTPRRPHPLRRRQPRRALPPRLPPSLSHRPRRWRRFRTMPPSSRRGPILRNRRSMRLLGWRPTLCPTPRLRRERPGARPRLRCGSTDR